MNSHSIAGHWTGEFDESALQQWAEALRQKFPGPNVSLGLIFIAPPLFQYARQILEIIRVHARVPLLAGCSSQGHIVGAEELEGTSGLTLGLYALPEAKLKAVRFTQEQVEAANGPGYWHQQTEVAPDETNGCLVFVDPFRIDSESWLHGWNEAYPGKPILGGLASGEEQFTQVYLNGDVFEEGGVAIFVGGKVKLQGVISQGCTPIGNTWTLTKVDQNIIHEIGNRRAYDVLVDTFNELPPEEQQRARGNLFIGLVMNEYLEEFRRGDFLIRNLLGGDPKSGSLLVGALPRAGQTMQFQRRSADAATRDMQELLSRAEAHLSGEIIYGGCLCSCNGRGRHLFGVVNHDASMVQQRLGPLGLTGFFCNGEIGPVGERNFLHGYTASLALFVNKKD